LSGERAERNRLRFAFLLPRARYFQTLSTARVFLVVFTTAEKPARVMEWKIALINIITGTTDFFLSKHVLINPGRRCVVISAAFFGVKMNDVNA
jgi:hypothetical protein